MFFCEKMYFVYFIIFVLAHTHYMRIYLEYTFLAIVLNIAVLLHLIFSIPFMLLSNELKEINFRLL